MKLLKIIFFVLVIFIITQCSSDSLLNRQYQGKDAIVLAEGGDLKAFRFDDIRLNSLKIVGDYLALNLSYSGGCRDHVFKLIAKEYFGESTIPRVVLVLSHNSNFDPCERYVTKEYTFNLLPLKYKYEQSFGKDSASILLVLEEHKVVYKF